MQNPKFQMFKSTENQQYYYRLRAENGKIVLNGEGYTTKQSCRDGVKSVQNNAPLEVRYERRNAPDNYTFVLKAANGEIIGRSEKGHSFSMKRSIGQAGGMTKKSTPRFGMTRKNTPGFEMTRKTQRESG